MQRIFDDLIIGKLYIQMELRNIKMDGDFSTKDSSEVFSPAAAAVSTSSHDISTSTIKSSTVDIINNINDMTTPSTGTTTTITSNSIEQKTTINDSANSSTQVSSNAPAVAPVIDRGHILNVNVGILGHVDSGKTSLVKSLSTHLSTAALDKNPQSQQRGITLDLGIYDVYGFSALLY